jgi:hypothetical protein
LPDTGKDDLYYFGTYSSSQNFPTNAAWFKSVKNIYQPSKIILPYPQITQLPPMTRFPHDQFAKHCFEPLLSSIGQFTPSLKVSAEVREIDIYFEPSSSALPPADLGLLYRCVSRATVFEPFRNAASPHEIRACASKLYELHNDIVRESKRSKKQPPKPDQRPFLWIITPTLSEAVQTEFGAIQKLEQWPPGVFFTPNGWFTGFIVANKLPKTPDTLWFRLFCTGKFQTQAFVELTQLPLDNPYRTPLLESLNSLRVILESRPSRTSNEQELFMQLSPLYLERIAAAEQIGEQRGRTKACQEIVLLLLVQKIGSLPSTLMSRIEALSMEQLQALTGSVLSLSSIEELSNWLDTEEINNS